MICDECETVAHCMKNGCVPKTTKKDKALKLALEALEGIHPSNMTPMAEEYWNKAITALREALAESALERMAENARELGLDYEQYKNAIEVSVIFHEGQRMFAVPKQPAPVAEPLFKPLIDLHPGLAEELKAMDTAQQEPGRNHWEDGDVFDRIAAIKEQPAQRQWVGLMDEEIIKAMPGGIYDCLNDPWDCGVGDGDTLRSIKKDVLRIARAIEAKLKEKNNG